jgi:hypothetical protein
MAVLKPVIPRLDRGIQKGTGCPLKTCGRDEKTALTLSLGKVSKKSDARQMIIGQEKGR